MGGLTALAVVLVAYTLVASRLDRWWITGPMVFVAAGDLDRGGRRHPGAATGR
jgi:sodium/hydrogen antiporter